MKAFAVITSSADRQRIVRVCCKVVAAVGRGNGGCQPCPVGVVVATLFPDSWLGTPICTFFRG